MTIDVSTLSVEVRSTGVKDTADGLNKIFKEAKKAEDRVKTLTDSIDKLSASFTSGSASALAYQQAVAQANRQVGGSNAATSALTTAMVGLTGTLRTLNTNFGNITPVNNHTASVRRNNDAMRDAHSLARGLSGSLGALWVTYGKAIPLAVGLAIGTSLRQIVTVGKDVENTLEGLRVKGDESFDSVDKLRGVVLDLGKGIYGPQEVAKALETLILAGLNAKDAMTGVKDALNLATVGGTSIEKSATTLVQVGTALGYTSEGFGRVGDVIAKTAAVSMSSVDSLSEAFKSASSVGKLYGASLVDIGTGLAALAQLGIQGSAAGTSLKNFYKELASGSDKVQNVFKAIGVNAKDLKDVNGNFLDMVTVVSKLSDGLNTLAPAQQKLALANLANERGMKTLVEVLDLYRTAAKNGGNALKEFHDTIADSFAFTAIGAANMALTVENQFKSVKNTMSSSFVEAFQAISPQLTMMAVSLKETFSSDKFKNTIEGLAVALTGLALIIAENLDKVVLLVAAFAGFKTVMFVVETIGAIAVAANAVSLAFGAARISATLFMGSLGILGALLVAGGTAWAYFTLNRDKSNETGRAAATTLEEYNKNLATEVDRMHKVNDQMILGKSLKDANVQVTQDEALALAEKNKNLMITAALEKKVRAEMELSDAPKGGAMQAQLKYKLDEANKEYDLAVTKGRGLYAEVKDNIAKLRGEARVQEAYQNQRIEQERARMASMAGSGAMPDKDAGKASKSITAEINGLKNLTVGYQAKADAYTVTAETQVRAMAGVHEAQTQAEIDSHKWDKASQAQRDSLLATARAADEAKFSLDGLRAMGEFSLKMGKDSKQQQAMLDEVNAGQVRLTGAREAATQALLDQWNVTRSVPWAAKLLDEARAYDANTLAVEKGVKANRDAEALTSDGRKFLEAADALLAYGKAGKASAIDLNELYIKQRQLDEGTQAGVINKLRGAASMKQMGEAADGLAKLLVGLNSEGEKSQADLVATFLTTEQAKLDFKRDATLRTIKMYADEAEAAKALATLTGTYDAEKIAAYQKVQGFLAATRSALDKNSGADGLLGKMKDAATIAEQAKSMASEMESAFGNVGKAIGGMVTGMADLAAAQAKYNAEMAAADVARSKGKGVQAIELERDATQALAVSQVKSYTSMIGGVKSLFNEKSKAFKILGGLEKSFHALSMAMELESMIRKIFFTEAVTAVKVGADTTQVASTLATVGPTVAAEGAKATASGITAFAVTLASLPFPFNVAAGAAVLALLVGAGVSMMGGGGSSGPSLSESRQKSQGTGTVLGDESAKSDSIAKSLESLNTNASIELTHSSAMLIALRSIDDGIGGMAASISSTSGLRGTAADEAALGVGSKGGFSLNLLSGILGYNKTSTTLTDSGIAFKPGQSVGSVLSSGVSANGYADLEKKSSSFFGLVKKSSSSELLSQLDPNLTDNMARTLNSMFNTVMLASTKLHVDPAVAEEAMKKLGLDILGLTKISLKGLSGADLEKELQAAFSRAGDVMAYAITPALKDFQKVGEGYLATMTRVSTGIEKGDSVLDKLGIQAVDFLDIVNKQGDVATEIVRDSIVNFEQASTSVSSNIAQIVTVLSGSADDIATVYTQLVALRDQFNGAGLNGNNLSTDTIRGAGGLDALNSGMQSFISNFFSEADQNAMKLADLTKQFDALGLSVPKSKDEFVALARAADDGTASGDKLVGKLVSLADTFNTVYESTVKLATDSMTTAFDVLKRSVDAEKKRLTDVYDAQVKAIKAQADADTKVQQDQLKPAQDALKDIQKISDAIANALKSTEVSTLALDLARRQEAQATLQQAQDYAAGGGSLQNFTGLTDALTNIAKPSEQFWSTLEDYQRDQGRTAMTLEGLDAVGKGQVDKAQLTIDSINATIEAIKDASTANLDALQSRHQDDLDRLDAIVTNAQAQIDSLNGINTSVLSVEQAVVNFQAALTGVYNAKGQAVPSDVKTNSLVADANLGVANYGKKYGSDAYLDWSKLGIKKDDGTANEAFTDNLATRMASIGSLASGHSNAYWMKVQELIDAGTPPSEQSMMTQFPGLAVGTNEVPEDMTANIHEGERIIPKADNAELMRRLKSPDEAAQGVQDLNAAINDLKQVIKDGDIANVQRTKELVTLLRRWDTDGTPGNRNTDLP